jgi:hypothetical protein
MTAPYNPLREQLRNLALSFPEPPTVPMLAKALGANTNVVHGLVHRMQLTVAKEPSPYWTPEEIEILVANPNLPPTSFGLLLPNRKPKSVWEKRRELAGRSNAPMRTALAPVDTGEVPAPSRPLPVVINLVKPSDEPIGPAVRCQYITNDSSPWAFCNEPSVPGYSWCKCHKAVVFIPMPAKRQFVAERV